jgi:predicted TIM-barrel fold metal-dependent hydrolase
MRDLIGVDRMMWSSDYPHAASTWPNSLDYVNRDFEGANDEDRHKITRGNVAKLYGFDL